MFSIEQIIYIKMDSALNNLQRLICHKTKQTNQLTNTHTHAHILWYIQNFRIALIEYTLSSNKKDLFFFLLLQTWWKKKHPPTPAFVINNLYSFLTCCQNVFLKRCDREKVFFFCFFFFKLTMYAPFKAILITPPPHTHMHTGCPKKF